MKHMQQATTANVEIYHQACKVDLHVAKLVIDKLTILLRKKIFTEYGQVFDIYLGDKQLLNGQFDFKIHTYICTFVFTHICVNVYVSACVYTHTHMCDHLICVMFGSKGLYTIINEQFGVSLQADEFD